MTQDILIEDNDLIESAVWLEDGVYRLDKVKDYIEVRHDNQPKLDKFMKKYPKFVVACAYETEWMILLSNKPEKLGKTSLQIGSGFNYGSTNILTNLPSSILILAEND